MPSSAVEDVEISDLINMQIIIEKLRESKLSYSGTVFSSNGCVINLMFNDLELAKK